mmetsp:Transcript_17197/g.37533  ORF Transcript_17197/g.37533 Transcript_17197/m.37533 type:complete len:141 (+) Transcript_17197:1044-1466(+)
MMLSPLMSPAVMPCAFAPVVSSTRGKNVAGFDVLLFGGDETSNDGIIDTEGSADSGDDSEGPGITLGPPEGYTDSSTDGIALVVNAPSINSFEISFPVSGVGRQQVQTAISVHVGNGNALGYGARAQLCCWKKSAITLAE